MLRESIDDLDALIAELTQLRQEMSHADLVGNYDDALWAVEAGLDHAAQRAQVRARVVRCAIDIARADSRRAQDSPMVAS